MDINIGAVIMAGGKATRFGQLGSRQPKCLLPLSDAETLLTRLLRQLQVAGIKSTTICCSPENCAPIESFLKTYFRSMETSQQTVRTISCPSTALGPLPALAEALREDSADWRLLCMADIFFAQEPYTHLKKRVASHPIVDGYVITGIDEMPVNGRGTGAVTCEGEAVRAISYRPVDTEALPAGTIRKWSGSFLFRTAMLPDLYEHTGEYQGAPYEAWLQGLLDRGARCEWIDAGAFINVNSMREYGFLIHKSRQRP